MTKEMAIMEIVSKSQEIESLDSCIKILEGWTDTEDLASPLKRRQKELERQREALYNTAAGGKFELEKAF